MLLWFIAAAIVSFIFGYIIANKFSLYRNVSGFALFWNYFVQFVKLNDGKAAVLNEDFLRAITKDFFDVLSNNPGVFTDGEK